MPRSGRSWRGPIRVLSDDAQQHEAAAVGISGDHSVAKAWVPAGGFHPKSEKIRKASSVAQMRSTMWCYWKKIFFCAWLVSAIKSEYSAASSK